MIFVFEDDPDMSISLLLKDLYKDVNECMIYFATSNTVMKQNVIQLKKQFTNDRIVMFVDVVPDSPDTIRIYEDLYESFYGDKNIMLLPIVCIEFYVLMLLTFSTYENEDVEKFVNLVLKGRDWRLCNNKRVTMAKTLETACKRFIGKRGFLPKEFLNINTRTSTKNDYGNFYIENSYALSVRQKSMLLWSVLPIMYNVNDFELINEFIKTKRNQFTWEERNIVLDYLRKYYKKLFESCDVAVIKIGW